MLYNSESDAFANHVRVRLEGINRAEVTNDGLRMTLGMDRSRFMLYKAFMDLFDLSIFGSRRAQTPNVGQEAGWEDAKYEL